MSKTNTRGISKKDFWLLCKEQLFSFFPYAVVLVGFLLRLRPAILQQLWLDEVASYFFSKLSFNELIFQNVNYWDAAHPSLYYIFLKIWGFWGNSELFLRLPTLLSYLGSAFFIYKIALYLDDKLFANLVLLYFSVHPFLVDLGYQVRMYGLVILLVLVAVYSLYHSLDNYKKKDQRKYFLATIISSSLVFYVDYAGAWFLVSLYFISFIWFFKKRNTVEKILPILYWVFILILPQLFILTTHFWEGLAFQRHFGRFDLSTFYYGITQLFGLGFSKSVSSSSLYFFSTLFVFISIMVFFSKRQKDTVRKFVRFFIVSFLLSVVGSATFSFLIQPIFQKRNFVIATIAIIFVVSYFLKIFLSKKTTLLSTLLLCVCFFIAQIDSSIKREGFDFTYASQVNWRNTMSLVTEQNPKVIFVGKDYWEVNPMENYYTPQVEGYELKIVEDIDELNNLSLEQDSVLVFFSRNLNRVVKENDIVQSQFCRNKQCHILELTRGVSS
jgi:uncharacterized membrane protein